MNAQGIIADTNYTSSNIKSGSSIFGLEGTYEGEETVYDIIYEEDLDWSSIRYCQVQLTRPIKKLVNLGFYWAYRDSGYWATLWTFPYYYTDYYTKVMEKQESVNAWEPSYYEDMGLPQITNPSGAGLPGSVSYSGSILRIEFSTPGTENWHNTYTLTSKGQDFYTWYNFVEYIPM